MRKFIRDLDNYLFEQHYGKTMLLLMALAFSFLLASAFGAGAQPTRNGRPNDQYWSDQLEQLTISMGGSYDDRMGRPLVPYWSDQLAYLDSIVGNLSPDSSVYVTVTRLKDSLTNYLAKRDSTLYVTIKRLTDTANQKLTIGGDTKGIAVNVGTNDAQQFVFKTNNLSRMYVFSDGNISINSATNSARLFVNGTQRMGGSFNMVSNNLYLDNTQFTYIQSPNNSGNLKLNASASVQIYPDIITAPTKLIEMSIGSLSGNLVSQMNLGKIQSDNDIVAGASPVAGFGGLFTAAPPLGTTLNDRWFFGRRKTVTAIAPTVEVLEVQVGGAVWYIPTVTITP